jgi:ATP-dependent DNA ligase
MIPYKKFYYIYPPRPEYAISPETMLEYDNYEYLAQPKLNGDSMLIFTNGIEVHIRNRHNKEFKKNIPNTERFLTLHRETPNADTNKWMVLCGEFMAKSKLNEWSENFNNNFVIFDIIVYDSVQLIGKTFEERVTLLDQLYGVDDKEILADGIRHYKFLYTTDIPTVYRVKSFRTCFKGLYEDLVKTDMYEGVVLKRANSKLENGRSEKNNTNSQLKIRKETKNYLY